MPPLFGPVIYGEHRPQSGATTKHPDDRQERNAAAVALPLESQVTRPRVPDRPAAEKEQVKVIPVEWNPSFEGHADGVGLM